MGQADRRPQRPCSAVHRSSTGAPQRGRSGTATVKEWPGQSSEGTASPQKRNPRPTQRDAQRASVQFTRSQGHHNKETPGQRLDLGLTMKPPVGFEPTTPASQERLVCRAVDLHVRGLGERGRSLPWFAAVDCD